LNNKFDFYVFDLEPKRSRTTNSSLIAASKKPWIELSHLYKSIDGHDIYKSIYESKIAISELTKGK